MTPESRNIPLLGNGSLKCVLASMDTLVEFGDVHFQTRACKKHVSVATVKYEVVDKVLGAVVSIRFAPRYKTGHVIDY
jgi:hypothetical protein